ncbi:uncharacterized protein LOC6584922 isoform X2 [Drosophila mojavensis]|uniref:uncharacterized protein LOC6584922 isoform X2 n=1 Tax=Drosophila mojavensis TaxID=7230 RepID=UPI001CD0EAA8|nr:uncharacterized protein LOC6584922 isoform X2 [Drosophila mojavensis]XP_043866462.1 uncharacterized protein LOC6584922 isoform X2 [Drosophila mojavensis]
MQFTTSCMMALLLLLLAITQLTTSAPAEALLELQDGSEPADLNPINAETKRQARAGGKDLSDAPELDRNNVSFELPDDLFTKSFRTVTQVSQAISRLIMNSARRYSRFVLFFKPVFGDALVVKGYEDPTTTTTMRTTTTTEEALKENEV